MRLARPRCTRAVVSIFVNPTQFAPHEDFDRYPRDEAGDLAKLASAAAICVWAPDARRDVPRGLRHARSTPAGAAEGLESDFRPHFFGGVATVCCQAVQPGAARRRRVRREGLPAARGRPPDGARPRHAAGDRGRADRARSRTAWRCPRATPTCQPSERRVAPTLNRAIREVAGKVAGGGHVEQATAAAKAALTAAGFGKIDYVEVRDAETLQPVSRAAPLRVLAAVWLGKTRLIDNVGVQS